MNVEKADMDKHPKPTFALANAPLVESLYEEWKADPASVPQDWQLFFQGFDLAMCPRDCESPERARAQSRVASLIYAFRSRGHLMARIDPLGERPTSHPELELSEFGFTEEDLGRVFDTGHLGGPERATLGQIIELLKETYCGPIGVEYVHIQERKVRRWLQGEMEPARNRPSPDRAAKLAILESLVDAELFETFLQSRFPGQKRFSLEGAESAIACLHALVEAAPEAGIVEIVLGMAHRGRLNVLANILDKSYAAIFSEFEGGPPSAAGGDADVKYHRGYSSDHTNRFGRTVHLALASNPSHLEAVDPVVLGKARAKQRRLGDTERRSRVMPVLVHGDSAFAGQGIVAEVLNLSQLEGYTTGGTFHLVINNQIGFTTSPKEARSSRYSTDVAKMVEAPIFHVNGDDPEAVVHVTELALKFRQEFHRDVVVDMLCYRRQGHNEGDEPAFTHPVLYKKIRSRPTVKAIYTEKLLGSGDLSESGAAEIAARLQSRLQDAFDSLKAQAPPPPREPVIAGPWEKLDNPYSHGSTPTAVGRGELLEVARALTSVPAGFRLNPKVAKRLPPLIKAVEEGGFIDWPSAELLAFGSLLLEGFPVRLSGQDSARGTFSQRHSVWQDAETQEPYTPLNNIREGQARFCVYNSMLSEAAVLGFDYGYSLSEPEMLVVWEAQFGDFVNGAQVIIDQFISSSLAKWRRASGIVMLLPHGQEGQGPEHSDARLERFLAACAEENIQVANITAPAQYFHALRRQVKRDFRRPLVVMAPKSLLRHPSAVSPLEAFTGVHFKEFLADPANPEGARRLVLLSGKLYYDVAEMREREGVRDAAIVRVEQFYPFNDSLFDEVISAHASATEVVWAQEETRNRGGWGFMFPRLMERFQGRRIEYAGRPEGASPAPGSLSRHKLEQAEIARRALGLVDR